MPRICRNDKRLTFDAFDTFDLCARAMAGMVETMTFHEDTMRAAAAHGFSTATDLADWLVRELGLPFRDAHHVTGALVAEAEARGVDLPDLPLEAMQTAEPRLTDAVYSVLTVETSVESRMSYGGAAPARVREQVRAMEAETWTGDREAMTRKPVILAVATVALLGLSACGLRGRWSARTRSMANPASRVWNRRRPSKPIPAAARLRTPSPKTTPKTNCSAGPMGTRRRP